MTPQEIGVTVKGMMGELTFDDFDYKNGAYVYKISEGKNSVNYSLSFSNKKLTKFASNMNTSMGDFVSKMKMTFSFTYKELIPSDPTK